MFAKNGNKRNRASDNEEDDDISQLVSHLSIKTLHCSLEDASLYQLVEEIIKRGGIETLKNHTNPSIKELCAKLVPNLQEEDDTPKYYLDDSASSEEETSDDEDSDIETTDNSSIDNSSEDESNLFSEVHELTETKTCEQYEKSYKCEEESDYEELEDSEIEDNTYDREDEEDEVKEYEETTISLINEALEELPKIRQNANKILDVLLQLEESKDLLTIKEELLLKSLDIDEQIEKEASPQQLYNKIETYLDELEDFIELNSGIPNYIKRVINKTQAVNTNDPEEVSTTHVEALSELFDNDVEEMVEYYRELRNICREELNLYKRKYPDQWRKLPNLTRDITSINLVREDQQTTDLAISSYKMKELIKQITEQTFGEYNFTENAFKAIHTTSEEYLTNLFSGANILAITGNRDYIIPQDMHTYLRLKQL